MIQYSRYARLQPIISCRIFNFRAPPSCSEHKNEIFITLIDKILIPTANCILSYRSNCTRYRKYCRRTTKYLPDILWAKPNSWWYHGVLRVLHANYFWQWTCSQWERWLLQASTCTTLLPSRQFGYVTYSLNSLGKLLLLEVNCFWSNIYRNLFFGFKPSDFRCFF